MNTEITKAIEKAEKDLNNIEEQREALFSRAKLLSKQREAVAFAAHTGDKQAKAKLADINLEDISIGNNIASVEAALTVARANLVQAKAAEAQANDKVKALQLREKLKKFVELGMILDDCFADFKSAATEMKAVLDDIHNLGQVSPTAQMFKVNCDLAFKTAVQGTPFWSQDFPAMHLASERHSRASLIAGPLISKPILPLDWANNRRRWRDGNPQKSSHR